jgi:hypothetical protein
VDAAPVNLVPEHSAQEKAVAEVVVEVVLETVAHADDPYFGAHQEPDSAATTVQAAADKSAQQLLQGHKEGEDFHYQAQVLLEEVVHMLHEHSN